jgi:hypothetical protein
MPSGDDVVLKKALEDIDKIKNGFLVTTVNDKNKTEEQEKIEENESNTFESISDKILGATGQAEAQSF